MCKRGEKRTKDPTFIGQQVMKVASKNYRTGEDEGVGNMHNCGGLHASKEPSQVDGGARPRPDPGVVGHLEGPTTIELKVSLPCKECTYETKYLPRRMAKR